MSCMLLHGCGHKFADGRHSSCNLYRVDEEYSTVQQTFQHARYWSNYMRSLKWGYTDPKERVWRGKRITRGKRERERKRLFANTDITFIHISQFLSTLLHATVHHIPSWR